MKQLGEKALAFAKHYVALVEALMSQGVPESTAREEARMTALLMCTLIEANEKKVCAVCGSPRLKEGE